MVQIGLDLDTFPICLSITISLGLALIIFLENSEYLKGLTSSIGGHVVIHESNTFAFPDKDGLSLAAGMDISVALRRTHISRLDQPHGDCESGHEFFSTYKHIYTRRTCQKFCEHKLIVTQCGCYDKEDEEVHRVLLLDKKFDWIHRPCISLEVLIQTLCESRSEDECDTYKKIDKRQFAQNFLKVSIFYEDLNYENITEQASYELTQFFSDIGGALGLWMGLSVVALLEVLHFLTSLMRLLTAFVTGRIRWLMDREKTGPLKSEMT
ncbi:amiloride-sensitive sodium channel subunit gamma [Elysia marginata]|uniref:Amiloride-sensitive sodium channel subunit gamma n=1 Tax=Elysia marginata TaxID=1093978 RepID=A0AAV4IYQ0_9GAST|nr:amiloride-sensitive sodium channel subunit gamma [Elysia marginata]